MATPMLTFADPFPSRPANTNAQAIIQSNVTNSALIIASKIDTEGIANSQVIGDAEVLRVFKAPIGFDSKKILVYFLFNRKVRP